MSVQPITSKPSTEQTTTASPPTATVPPRLGVGAPKPKKPRSSCDGCGIAKVKCDRGHPECGRCTSLGLNCVYGLSRKFGKPPRKRFGADLDATITQKRLCTSGGATESRDSHATSLGFREHQNCASEPTPADFSDIVANILPISHSTNLPLGFNEQSQFTPAFYPSMPLEEWPQLGSWGAGLEEIPSASGLEPASTALNSGSNSHESHSCARESYEIFRDLICPSPSLHAPESNSVTVSAELDQVLHFNRHAVDRLKQLLKCHCAKSGHRAMVHASIVSRILIWYQQAAGWTCSNRRESSPSSPPPPSDGAEASASAIGVPSLTQTTGFTVANVPVSIGTFSIGDNIVLAAFRNQLILSELKMTADLIDMFMSQESGGSSATGVASLYSHLGIWLRSEHSRTVKILRSRLDALNENLES